MTIVQDGASLKYRGAHFFMTVGISSFELEMRNINIQVNVQRMLKEQQEGLKVKKRIRIDGSRQRIDSARAQPKMVFHEGTPHEATQQELVLGPNTPYDTSFVNSGDKIEGDYISFTYYHTKKCVHIKGSRWKKSDTIKFVRLPSYFQGLLGVNQGTATKPVFVPDPNKMEKLEKTGLVADGLCLVIKPDPNNPHTRDWIEIKRTEQPSGTIMITICDREDYSRVYSMKSYLPTTGKLLYMRDCSNFDSQGFPHKVTVIEYDIEGNFKEKSVYRIVKVDLNPSIPDEVFEFNPPEGYQVIDNREQ